MANTDLCGQFEKISDKQKRRHSICARPVSAPGISLLPTPPAHG